MGKKLRSHTNSPSGWSAILCNYQRMYAAKQHIFVNVTCQPNFACKIYVRPYNISAVYPKPFTAMQLI